MIKLYDVYIHIIIYYNTNSLLMDISIYIFIYELTLADSDGKIEQQLRSVAHRRRGSRNTIG